MFMNLLRWVLSLVLTVAAVLFALGNRDDIAFTWSPVHDAVQMPVFAPVLMALLAGFLMGGLFVWIGGSAVRRERRRQRKEIARLQTQLREAEDQLALQNAVGVQAVRQMTPHEPLPPGLQIGAGL